MKTRVASDGFTKVLHPESLKLFAGSHVLCVCPSGSVLQGKIIKAQEVTRDRVRTRYLVLELSVLLDKEEAETPTPPNPQGPEAVAASLLDGVGGR